MTGPIVTTMLTLLALACAWALPTMPEPPAPPDVEADQCVQFSCDCAGAPDRSGRWADCECTCTEWSPYL